MNSFEIISKVLPVFLLFILGYIFRRTGFLYPQTASQMKKLVANITLPALLFRAFMSLEPGRDELLLALMMFALSGALLIGTRLLMRLIGRKGDIRGYMVSGFEAGMLGYALFLSVFGDAALPVFASVDLGQVLFVFVVLMPMLLARRGLDAGGLSSQSGREALLNVVKSPVVWAILSGLILGSIGRALHISQEPFAPISGFLEIIGNLTVPVIALAIGYELSFSRKLMGKALVFVLIRKVVLLGIALLMIRFLPVKNDMTSLAFMTMLLLPPPFVVTLAAREEELGLVSGILSLSTVVSIPAFAAAVLLMGV
ncbi:MAG: AEC family transporter, partial [Spirochaetaceae bacterium]|nr:AEC family transporter [Spirochaetaceae bacterium]